MERAYEKWLGTALLAVGLALLLFGFYQAYGYTQTPPAGVYPVVTGGGGTGNGSGGSLNLSFNGRFLEAFAFLGIEYLVGASILRAGWNLITPKAETISVRVKPRSLQVEPAAAVAPATSAPPAAPTRPASSSTSVGPPPAGPTQATSSPEPWVEGASPPPT